ncbi:unnamed protein product [Pleuronectes platessa]|uniref:Uncharacterized protein n=1 Tax=Pleuronectes platessa TaxID=8262 RepID=A0A9N7VQW6_PLEPL|nr:unnamed protein product [Pleuronectes platessa]
MAARSRQRAVVASRPTHGRKTDRLSRPPVDRAEPVHLSKYRAPVTRSPCPGAPPPPPQPQEQEQERLHQLLLLLPLLLLELGLHILVGCGSLSACLPARLPVPPLPVCPLLGGHSGGFNGETLRRRKRNLGPAEATDPQLDTAVEPELQLPAPAPGPGPGGLLLLLLLQSLCVCPQILQ